MGGGVGAVSQTLMPQKVTACWNTVMSHIRYKIETELETDGRWIAEVVDVAGVLAYGATEKEAIASAQALALRILGDRIEQ